MRLFFKHLLRSMSKKPLQPVILTVTAILAMLVSLFSFTVDNALVEEVNGAQAAGYGNADISVELTSSSQSRFMFESDVTDVLGESSTVVGCLELPMLVGEEKQTVAAVATDFARVGEIFELGFSDYGALTPSSVPGSAFISKYLAENMGLSLNDELKVVAFGSEKTYKIVGISEGQLIGSNDIMVDISGIVRAMAEDSLLISAISDSFRPSTSLYVRLEDGKSVSDAISILEGSEKFADKEIVAVEGIVGSRSNIKDLSIIISVVVLIAIFTSAAVAFSCFYILSLERSEENFIFLLSGAKPGFLLLLQYVEVVAYWLIGCALGTALAIPVINGFISFAGFRHASGGLSAFNISKSAFYILVMLLLTVGAFAFTRQRKRERSANKRNENLIGLAFTVILTALYILIFVLNVKYRFTVFIISLIAIMLALFLCIPFIMRRISARIASALEKRSDSKYLNLRYALKNIFALKSLQNIARLISVITLSMLMILTMVVGIYGYFDNATHMLDSDYAVLGAADECYEKIISCEGVESAYRIYLGESKEVLISCEDVSVFSDSLELQITEPPRNNNAVITVGYAKKADVEIGDSLEIFHDGKAIELIITEIVDYGCNFILFDCNSFDISYNMILVNGAAGVSDGDLLSQISHKTALELAPISTVEEFFNARISTLQIYLEFGKAMLIIVFIFTLMGALNGLYETYRSRKDEFKLFECSGMSREGIRRVKTGEILFTVIFGFFFGIVSFIIYIPLLKMGMETYGVEILTYVMGIFKA